ncbi:MAG: peptidylprolyl isomerase [Candidatus Omnitrophica bacterium]|nr:peptidylprolyl isomerase [Candidatus Omnitrophota bacterium]
MKKVLALLFLSLLFVQHGTTNVSAQENIIEEGKTVLFEYTLTVDGEVADSSADRGPLKYIHGQRQIIPGLEDELAGMKVGDKKTVTVPPEKAYGLVNDQMILEVDKERLGEDIEPEVGLSLTLTGDDGQSFQGVITEILEDKLIVDFNHPLAGKDLKFDVEIIDIQ